MNTALWIAAGLLAFVALTGGVVKLFVPKTKLAKQPGARWVEGVSGGFVKLLGVLEILAAVGLILPPLVNIAPVLVPVTAVCWILLMICAMIAHLRHGEAKLITLNLIYLLLAAFIAWGYMDRGAWIGAIV